MSLGKVEATLKHSKYVENCCAYGDSQESYILVLVVPVAAQLHTLATSLGVDGSLEELCSNKTVVEAVLKDVTAVSKEGILLISCIKTFVKCVVSLNFIFGRSSLFRLNQVISYGTGDFSVFDCVFAPNLREFPLKNEMEQIC